MKPPSTSAAEVRELRALLREATETLEAIRHGEVDALVVEGPDGPGVYALRSADHPYRMLVEQMHEGAATLSRKGITLYANQRFAQLAGLPLEQVIGRAFSDLVAEGSKDGVTVMLASLPGHCEGFLRAPSRDVPVALAASEMVVGDEKYVALVVSDLTEQKRREAILDAERLTRTRLEDANRAKDEFLITVSHELRTPLTAILGWATMLRRYDLDAATERIAYDAIEQCTRIQASLVDDLLDISRIATGKVRLNMHEVSVADTVERAVATVATTAAARHVRLTTRLGGLLPPVRGDSVRLQQVFWNLLTNAIKFTPEGGAVEISAEREGPEILVRVRDTGCGISAEFLPHMFERFSQEDVSTRRSQAGMGIGLSVAHDLVRLHGGTISGASAGAGEGTVLTVRLPVAVESPAEIAVHESLTFAEKTLEGLSILAVEDDPSTRTWLTRTLEFFGAHVVPAASVSDALTALDGLAADIVLSDLAMPVEDGLALIAKLRVREDSKSTPVIALTAFGKAEDGQQILSAGFNHYLRKPIDPIDLVHVIHALTKPHGHA